MNCQTFRTVVHEIDLNDGLEAGALDAALGHAQSCGRCARQLHESRELRGSLRALALADRERQPSSFAEARLVAAFRARAVQSRSAWKARLGMAAAAAVLVAVAAGLTWVRYSKSLREAPEPARSMAAVSGPSAAVPLATGPIHPIPAAAQRSVRPSQLSRGARQSNPAGSEEELGSFIPLPFADEDAPLGLAEVVRIRLSDSDLSLLGMPVDAEASARSLTADVVIGEDGVARAIRFLPSSSDAYD